MTLMEGLWVSIFGMGVVFIVLIILSFLVQLQSRLLSAFVTKSETPRAETENPPLYSISQEKEDAGFTAGEVKLFGVDEKTAAMIMAIVSDESGIPLSELQFKSIKALEK